MKTFLSKIKTSIYFGGLAVGLSLGLNSGNAGEILIGIPAAQSGPGSQALPINDGDNNVGRIMRNLLDAFLIEASLPGSNYVGEEKHWR